MDELINNCLTLYPMLDNLSTLLPHVTVRFGHREITRCLKRVYSWIALFNAKNNLWWRCLGRESVQDSCVLLTNPNNVTARFLVKSSGVFSQFTRVHTMSQDNSAQQSNTQAQAEQYQTIITDNAVRPMPLVGVSSNQEGG